MENQYYPFENLPLPYDYDAMTPFIDAPTMRIHHDKHLQTYIDNLNAVLEHLPDFRKHTLEEMLRFLDEVPEEWQGAVRNNAGGVYNHRMYFDMLQNPSDLKPSGRLAEAINNEFGSYDEFKKIFKGSALKVFGSGYAWLVCDSGKLRIVTTPNQDNPITHHMTPILCLDVWEHAYYLKHQNVRAAYIDDWFMIINWHKAEEIFCKC